MSLRPKRTPLRESSTTKLPRCSRIAQLIRRPSQRDRSLERASSADRISNTGYVPTSAIKRSSSATPLRTPNRPIPYSSGLTLFTNEKERIPLDDKKFIQGQASRVTEYLHAIEPTLGKEFFQRGGLKAMSTKQFVVIFTHFLQFIVGNRFTIGPSFVEDIVKVLAQIEYPYTINKSWLKTPTAPHAFHNVVILFGWMLNFVPNQDMIDEFEKELLIPTADLPDKEYALNFVTSAKLGFTLWNNHRNDEFSNLKKDLMDTYILKRTGHVDSLVFLESETKRLCAEVEKYERSKSMQKIKEECSRLEERYSLLNHRIHEKQNQLNRLEESCIENRNKVARLEKMAEKKQKLITEQQARIESLDAIVKSQKTTVADRDALVSKVQYLKQLLESKKSTVYGLQDLGATNQVLYSRLRKQTIEGVSNFNSYLYTIFADLDDLTDVKVQDYCLDQSSAASLVDQIDAVVPLLENLKKSSFQQMKIYTRQVNEVENQLKIAIYEHDAHMDQKLALINQRCAEFMARNEQLDIEIINTTTAQRQEIEGMSFDYEKLVESNAELEKKILLKVDELEALKIENEYMLAKVTNRCEKFLKAKKARIRVLSESVNSFCNTLEEIHLKLKDFR